MMYEPPTSKKILWTADVISKYIGVSRNGFYDLVKMGLPAVVIGGKWCAHADNLEMFFQRGTAVVTKNIPNEAD